MSITKIKCEICEKTIFEVSCYLYDVFNYHTEAVCIDCYDKLDSENKHHQMEDKKVIRPQMSIRQADYKAFCKKCEKETGWTVITLNRSRCMVCGNE